MHAGSIGIYFLKIGQHCFNGNVAHFCCSCIICVDKLLFHNSKTFSFNSGNPAFTFILYAYRREIYRVIIFLRRILSKIQFLLYRYVSYGTLQSFFCQEKKILILFVDSKRKISIIIPINQLWLLEIAKQRKWGI